jgi:PAS domain S-box-containing protein
MNTQAAIAWEANRLRNNVWWVAMGVICVAVVVLGHGFTEQQQQLTALRAETSLARLRAQRLVDSTPSALVMCDRAGIFTVFNPAAEEMFGWTAAEVVGKKPITLLMQPTSKRAHEELLKLAGERLMSSKEPWQITRRHIYGEAVCKDGKVLHVELSMRGITYGETVEFIAAIRNIDAPETESKAIPK